MEVEDVGSRVVADGIEPAAGHGDAFEVELGVPPSDASQRLYETLFDPDVFVLDLEAYLVRLTQLPAGHVGGGLRHVSQ